MKNPFSSPDVRFLTAKSGSLECGSVRREMSSAFSLVEVLVVISILSLIVLVLMSVFNSTQAAFRAGVSQTDVLEGSRSAMDLMTSDLKLMAASGGFSNTTVNLSSIDNEESGIPTLAYAPLVQTLLGVNPTDTARTNLLNYFFFLTKQGTSWAGTGYVVNSAGNSPLFALYRYHVVTNQYAAYYLAGDFYNKIHDGQWTNLSHLIDGVVDLRLRAYDANGYQMVSNLFFANPSGRWFTNQNVAFFYPNNFGRETGFYFYSNALPATVELQMGVLEDRVLQRAESLGSASTVGLSLAQSNYLANQAGRVHVFRQRVTIPNLDRTSYQ